MQTTVEKLIKQARKNEDIAEKLFEIEVKILSITRFKSFFAELLDAVKKNFRINHVWLSMIENVRTEPLLEALDNFEELRDSLILLSDALYRKVSGMPAKPVLINEGLECFDLLMPLPVRSKVKSVALLPLTMEGRPIGCLMFGDESADRYRPDKDSFFLKQLAVKASLCLSAVAAQERVLFLAARDPLTLLRNRREMDEVLKQELNRADRQQTPIAALFIDCDDFKQVNDTYGHDCGDEYLKYVASGLQRLIRQSDIAFRFAGDEFVVLLPNQTLEDAQHIAGRIREHFLDHPLQHQDAEIQVKMSFGAASSQEISDCTPDALLKKADERLYEMKKLKPSKR